MEQPREPLETTASLLEGARQGDLAARERLFARYLPLVRAWAHGRLPSGARRLAETDDLVQITLLRALDQLPGFEPRRPGAFLAYLRRIVINQVRDEIRRAVRRGDREPLGEDLPAPGRSPLEEAIGSETLERYEAALTQLTQHQQEAVVLRVELGLTYPEIADALGLPTANAARMLVARGLVRLTEALDDSG